MSDVNITLSAGGKFKLGGIYLTKNVFDECHSNAHFHDFVKGSIRRHSTGDWGDISDNDKRENDYSIDRSLRIFSAFNHIESGLKIWIITEADRSVTTVLYPDDY